MNRPSPAKPTVVDPCHNVRPLDRDVDDMLDGPDDEQTIADYVVQRSPEDQ